MEPKETLTKPNDLGRWAVTAGLVSDEFVAVGGELLDARRLRSALYELAQPEALIRDRTQSELVNHFAAMAPRSVLTIDTGTGQPFVESPSIRSAAELLGVIADDFIRIARENGLAEIKECAHQRCGLLFLDCSRGGRRHWCSMGRCGNRAKAQRHAQRSVSRAGDTILPGA